MSITLHETAALVARLQSRYPAGLICVSCAAILATRPASYAKSNLTEANRLTYRCFECRADVAEIEGLKEARRAHLRQGRAVLQAARTEAHVRDETGGMGNQTGPDVKATPAEPMNHGVTQQGFVTPGRLALRAAGARLRRARPGGRPRQYPTRAAQQQAYRLRRKLGESRSGTSAPFRLADVSLRNRPEVPMNPGAAGGIQL